jgi:hypothetical protein
MDHKVLEDSPPPFSLPLSLETSSEEVVYKPPGYITALICAPLVSLVFRCGGLDVYEGYGSC